MRLGSRDVRMKWLIRLGPYVHIWGKNGEYDVCRSPIYIRIVRNRVQSMKEEILDLIIG